MNMKRLFLFNVFFFGVIFSFLSTSQEALAEIRLHRSTSGDSLTFASWNNLIDSFTNGDSVSWTGSDTPSWNSADSLMVQQTDIVDTLTNYDSGYVHFKDKKSFKLNLTIRQVYGYTINVIKNSIRLTSIDIEIRKYE